MQLVRTSDGLEDGDADVDSHGRLYTTRLAAGNENDAPGKLALFKGEPDAYMARAQAQAAGPAAEGAVGSSSTSSARAGRSATGRRSGTTSAPFPPRPLGRRRSPQEPSSTF